MKSLHDFADIHRHLPADNTESAVVNLTPGTMPGNEGWYSAGIHPWQADSAGDYMSWLGQVALLPNVLAIGECGLDKLRGPSLDIQLPVFTTQIELSERVGKPLIIHNVKCTDQLIALRRKFKPRQEWIIHGFRGGPEQARQLLAHGFSLSFGKHYNRAAFDLTPADRRYSETDA